MGSPPGTSITCERCSDSSPKRVAPNRRARNVNQAGLVQQSSDRHSSWHRRRRRNSQEPAAWHALGCAASPSCHLQRVKPSAGCRNLCPLRFILGRNLSWGHWVGHWGSVRLIMYVCLMSPCVQLSHQLPTHLDFKLEETWSIAAAAGECVCKS